MLVIFTKRQVWKSQLRAGYYKKRQSHFERTSAFGWDEITSSRPAVPSGTIRNMDIIQKSSLHGDGDLQKQWDTREGRTLERWAASLAAVILTACASSECDREAKSGKSLMQSLGGMLQGNKETSKLLAEMWGSSSTQLVFPSGHFLNSWNAWGRGLKSIVEKLFKSRMEFFSNLVRQVRVWGPLGEDAL